ncbi:MAG: prephenate dehydratase [Candidatus Zixiibacteriota bacterium]
MTVLEIAFQGERGSFSEEAARRFFGPEITPDPKRTFPEVFTAVESGAADFGVVPVENSLVGSIHQNYDLLLRRNLKIIGEQNQRIVHHLIVNPGTTLDHLTSIHSHPVALDQCKEYLQKHSKLTVVVEYDTAGSVKLIKEQTMNTAGAIAGAYAAELYEMQILASAIQDEPDNYTRFLILSKNPAERTERCKTSIVFALKNIPGVLFKALSVFALRDLDLTKIESRPLRKKAWEYYFYLDFVGHVDDEAARNAVTHLREITTFLKILGSYPMSE